MQAPTQVQASCLTCSSAEHGTINCPDYTDADRQMMLRSAELFVHNFTDLREYGQNCLNDFADTLQPADEPQCAYCGEPLARDQLCSSPISDVHESCYYTMEGTQEEQF